MVANGAPDASLVETLAQPGFYPHRPPSVEIRQTHISWVFLAGGLVYKLKKPVRFRFLDYSSREQRLESCLAEVRLNRRLAPTIYLGVVAVRRHGAGFALGSVDDLGGEAEDYLVAMRRLPEEEMLDRRLARGTAGAAELEQVAAKLVAFHAACPDRGEAYGSREVVAEAVLGNLAEYAAVAEMADPCHGSATCGATSKRSWTSTTSCCGAVPARVRFATDTVISAPSTFA
jgi:aminoglycoside phosphotransferase family enzyme